jgi:hypothetical protein
MISSLKRRMNFLFVWVAALFYYYIASNFLLALERFLPTQVSVWLGVVFKL